jgi:hypothetical protein
MTNLQEVKKEYEKKFPIEHVGCEDGYYACPKSEDYFGEGYEDLPIKERPCYCGVIETHKRVWSFIESSIKQAVEAERKEIAVFVENLFKAGAINRGQLLGSSIVEAIRNFPPKGITKKEEKELLKHMGHLAYTGKGKKKE